MRNARKPRTAIRRRRATRKVPRRRGRDIPSGFGARAGDHRLRAYASPRHLSRSVPPGAAARSRPHNGRRGLRARAAAGAARPAESARRRRLQSEHAREQLGRLSPLILEPDEGEVLADAPAASRRSASETFRSTPQATPSTIFVWHAAMPGRRAYASTALGCRSTSRAASAGVMLRRNPAGRKTSARPEADARARASRRRRRRPRRRARAGRGRAPRPSTCRAARCRAGGRRRSARRPPCDSAARCTGILAPAEATRSPAPNP